LWLETEGLIQKVNYLARKAERITMVFPKQVERRAERNTHEILYMLFLQVNG